MTIKKKSKKEFIAGLIAVLLAAVAIVYIPYVVGAIFNTIVFHETDVPGFGLWFFGILIFAVIISVIWGIMEIWRMIKEDKISKFGKKALEVAEWAKKRILKKESKKSSRNTAKSQKALKRE